MSARGLEFCGVAWEHTRVRPYIKPQRHSFVNNPSCDHVIFKSGRDASQAKDAKQKAPRGKPPREGPLKYRLAKSNQPWIFQILIFAGSLITLGLPARLEFFGDTSVATMSMLLFGQR